RPGDLLRTPRHARLRLGAPAVPGRRLCRTLRRGAPGARRERGDGGGRGGEGRGLRAGRGCLADRRGGARPAHARPLRPCRGARLGGEDAPLSHRARGQPHRRLRRRDRGAARARVLLQPRCAHRAAGDARHPEPAQSAPARGGGAERGAYHALPAGPRERLAMTETIEVRARAEETEGTRLQLLRWLKQVGDPVEANEPLIEIETDKVTVEVAAPRAGVLREILKREQEEIAPGELLGRLESGVPAAAGAVAAAPAAARAPVPATPPRPAARGTSAPLSPAVRRLLAEHGLAAADLTGSGQDGRLTVEDVLRAAAARAPGAAATPAPAPTAPAPAARR